MVIGIALFVLAVVLGKIGRDYWQTRAARKVVEREVRRAQIKADVKAILRESRHAEE